MGLVSYFTDPVLSGSTIGSMLMCCVSGLVGVLVVLRKKSLVGETLSHASYPGIVITAFACEFLSPQGASPFALLIGAGISALIGWLCVEALERRGVRSDAALCFVLSSFFGIGILIASRLQFLAPLTYQNVQIFLYGQAATMGELHIWIYALLSLGVIFYLKAFYRAIEIMLFDRGFGLSIGLSFHLIDTLLATLLVFVIILGIRSVGVILMVGMLIAPAVAARQFTHRLPSVFCLAGGFGILSGFLGNYLSIELPILGGWFVGGRHLVLPTGPMILLSAGSFALFALLCAPKRGLLFRYLRALGFQKTCLLENILKHFWKQNQPLTYVQLKAASLCSPFLLSFLLRSLVFQGWLCRNCGGCYRLSPDGELRAARTVRLHRLWEVYLVSLGQGKEKVHRSAEEMEHILTPELEQELILLLGDPKEDPHAQPIPHSASPKGGST